MNTSIIEHQQLRDLLEDKIRNEYLERHIQKPIIHEGKLQILAELVYNNDSLNTIQKERYIITTMMVQLALDTHDLVPVGDEETESNEEKLSKQLNVLAGDYYSGLYYYLLSEIEDVELIHTLATAIKNINEYKMKLYYKEIDSFEAFLDITKQIDSMLLVEVANLLDDHSLSQVMGDWLLAERLILEKNDIDIDNRVPILEQWCEMDIKTTHTVNLSAIDPFIQQLTDRVDKNLLRLPDKNKSFKNLFKTRLEHMGYYQSPIVEEG